MKRILLHKIASSVARLNISRQALVTDVIVPQAGYALAVRALDRKSVYNQLEDVHGRMTTVYPGDQIVGILGERRALRGHAGKVPEQIEVGDVLHLLNLGGVIGECTSSNPDVGPPLRVEVLGAVLAFPVLGSRQGVPAHIGMNALTPVQTLQNTPPIVFISGTCMDSGKTRAACEIVRTLAASGLHVAAAKLTGVALKRDVMGMVDCGATQALTFVDAGCPSTSNQTAPDAARAVLGALAKPGKGAFANTVPDVIVAELGDGLLGEYGVMPILEQADIQGLPAVHVCCATDPVGAFGAMNLFTSKLGLTPHVFTGPATDNAVGSNYIRDNLGVSAFNALREPEQLGACVMNAVQNLVQTKQSTPSIVSEPVVAGGASCTL